MQIAETVKSGNYPLAQAMSASSSSATKSTSANPKFRTLSDMNNNSEPMIIGGPPPQLM